MLQFVIVGGGAAFSRRLQVRPPFLLTIRQYIISLPGYHGLAPIHDASVGFQKPVSARYSV